MEGLLYGGYFTDGNRYGLLRKKNPGSYNLGNIGKKDVTDNKLFVDTKSLSWPVY